MLLVLNRPPVCEVCPNNEVVMFKPRTGTSPDLGSITITNLLLVYPAPPVSTVLWIFLPPLGLTTTIPPSIKSRIRSISFYCTRISPPTSPGIGYPTCRLPPLVPALTSLDVPNILSRSLPSPGVPLSMPVNVVSLIRYTPLYHHQTAPRSLSAPRGFTL